MAFKGQMFFSASWRPGMLMRHVLLNSIAAAQGARCREPYYLGFLRQKVDQ